MCYAARYVQHVVRQHNAVYHRYDCIGEQLYKSRDKFVFKQEHRTTNTKAESGNFLLSIFMSSNNLGSDNIPEDFCK